MIGQQVLQETHTKHYVAHTILIEIVMLSTATVSNNDEVTRQRQSKRKYTKDISVVSLLGYAGRVWRLALQRPLEEKTYSLGSL